MKKRINYLECMAVLMVFVAVSFMWVSTPGCTKMVEKMDLPPEVADALADTAQIIAAQKAADEFAYNLFKNRPGLIDTAMVFTKALAYGELPVTEENVNFAVDYINKEFAGNPAISNQFASLKAIVGIDSGQPVIDEPLVLSAAYGFMKGLERAR